MGLQWRFWVGNGGSLVRHGTGGRGERRHMGMYFGGERQDLLNARMWVIRGKEESRIILNISKSFIYFCFMGEVYVNFYFPVPRPPEP